jgi:hypothetical protein
MYSLIVVLSLFGQGEIGVPPAPGVDLPPNPAVDQSEDLRTWLLARLVIDSSFDERKSTEARRLLATMNESQLKALVAAYKERTEKEKSLKGAAANSTPLDANQQIALDNAKLNLQQAEAYRDHLKREYDRQILQGQMTQNLVYQNIVNNQMMMNRTYGPYTYGAFGVGPFSVGGLGYGVLNYGPYGYGAPMYGPGFYGRAW